MVAYIELLGQLQIPSIIWILSSAMNNEKLVSLIVRGRALTDFRRSSFPKKTYTVAPIITIILTKDHD